MSLAKLEKHLLTFPDVVSRELTVSDKATAEQPDLYHISACTNIKEFVPRISEYQMEGEDRSVPRVVTGTTLLGCILGYACMEKDYLDNPVKEEDPTRWKNGYQIYKFDYGLAVKPSNKLVPSASQTDETWLLGYSADTATYAPKKIGKFFAKEFVIKIQSGQHHEVETVIFAEITDPEGMQLSKNHRLAQGFWQVEIENSDDKAWMHRSWFDDEKIVWKSIGKEDYMAAKQAIAAMLSRTEEKPFIKPPAYATW